MYLVLRKLVPASRYSQRHKLNNTYSFFLNVINDIADYFSNKGRSFNLTKNIVKILRQPRQTEIPLIVYLLNLCR